MSDTVRSLFSKGASAGQTVLDNYSNQSTAGKLQAGGSMLSALQTFGAAMQRSSQLKTQAVMETGAAVGDIGNFNQAATEAGNRYLDAMSATNAAAAGSGIDVGSGSVLAMKAKMGQELNNYNSIARENAVSSALVHRSRMFALRAEAAKTKTFGVLSLMSSIVSTASSISGRGSLAK